MHQCTLTCTNKEKVYIVVGPEFGPDLEGRVMLVLKSLYELTTSAARWHEELSKTLRGMGFTPTKADHDLWIKDCGTHYEYLCTWVDNIVVASKDVIAILNEFETKAKYTLKGVGEPSYYLGGNFGRINTTLLPGKKSTCFLSARTYIKNVCEKIEETFNMILRSHHAPMRAQTITQRSMSLHSSLLKMALNRGCWLGVLCGLQHLEDMIFYTPPRLLPDTMPFQ